MVMLPKCETITFSIEQLSRDGKACQTLEFFSGLLLPGRLLFHWLFSFIVG